MAIVVVARLLLAEMTRVSALRRHLLTQQPGGTADAFEAEMARGTELSAAATALIEQARAEAERILEQARREAELIRARATPEGVQTPSTSVPDTSLLTPLLDERTTGLIRIGRRTKTARRDLARLSRAGVGRRLRAGGFLIVSSALLGLAGAALVGLTAVAILWAVDRALG